MPLISHSKYQRPKWLFNRHLETVFPALFRKVPLRSPQTERIDTPDGDFLDLDWYRMNNEKLVIISHGLEGNSRRPYILGMAKIFLQNGFDVLCWNYRGCGEELNNQPIFYHSGATYDLDTVVSHAAEKYGYISLIGFSLGGNLTLKYLGEDLSNDKPIEKGVAISVPLHLASSSEKISSGSNKLYSDRFLKTLREKVLRKAKNHPDQIPIHFLERINKLSDFDDFFTGPLHGFSDAKEYYQVNSSLFFLEKIKTPTLILNAQNDPFLSDLCFPVKLAKDLDPVYFEFPKQGGHVGFTSSDSSKPYFSEKRAFEFVSGDF